MTLAIRVLLRLLFWPIGLAMLAGTAAIEAMANTPDWDDWKDWNGKVLEAMWLQK